MSWRMTGNVWPADLARSQSDDEDAVDDGDSLDPDEADDDEVDDDVEELEPDLESVL